MQIGAKLRGALLTMRSMGARTLIREMLRRGFGIGYTYRGVPVRDSETFRVLRNLMVSGRRFRVSEERIYVETRYGILAVPLDEAKLLEMDTLTGGIYDAYNVMDVKDSIVVDVGAYIGDTVVYFASRGARRIYAYEPVKRLFEILLENIKLNRLEDRVKAFNAGVWYRDGMLTAQHFLYPSTLNEAEAAGGEEGEAVRVVDLGSVLASAAGEERLVVKMDCEGCEYSLLLKPCETLQLADQYLVEIHGAYNVIASRMHECGFKPRLVKIVDASNKDFPVTLWLFTKNK